jgi:hypothetical protein
MEDLRRLFVMAALTLAASACKPIKSTDSVASGITDSGAASLQVVVSTAWEDAPSDFEVQNTCSQSGTKEDPGEVDCLVPIGEEQLFYSKLKFEISTSGDCTVIQFTPYRYRASSDAAYVPPEGGGPFDCSVADTVSPVECWGGVAKELVPDFPAFVGLFSTSGMLSQTISSSNEILGHANRYTSNDMLAADRGVDLAPVGSFEGYVADSMVDYTAQCVDKWANVVSTINVFVQDFDGDDPADDQIESWDN